MADQCADKITPWGALEFEGWIRPSLKPCIPSLIDFPEPEKFIKTPDIDVPDPDWYDCFCSMFNIAGTIHREYCGEPPPTDKYFGITIENTGDCCNPDYNIEYKLTLPCDLTGISGKTKQWYKEYWLCDAVQGLGSLCYDYTDCKQCYTEYCNPDYYKFIAEHSTKCADIKILTEDKDTADTLDISYTPVENNDTIQVGGYPLQLIGTNIDFTDYNTECEVFTGLYPSIPSDNKVPNSIITYDKLLPDDKLNTVPLSILKIYPEDKARLPGDTTDIIAVVYSKFDFDSSNVLFEYTDNYTDTNNPVATGFGNITVQRVDSSFYYLIHTTTGSEAAPVCTPFYKRSLKLTVDINIGNKSFLDTVEYINNIIDAHKNIAGNTTRYIATKDFNYSVISPGDMVIISKTPTSVLAAPDNNRNAILSLKADRAISEVQIVSYTITLDGGTPTTGTMPATYYNYSRDRTRVTFQGPPASYTIVGVPAVVTDSSVNIVVKVIAVDGTFIYEEFNYGWTYTEDTVQFISDEVTPVLFNYPEDDNVNVFNPIAISVIDYSILTGVATDPKPMSTPTVGCNFTQETVSGDYVLGYTEFTTLKDSIQYTAANIRLKNTNLNSTAAILPKSTVDWVVGSGSSEDILYVDQGTAGAIPLTGDFTAGTILNTTSYGVALVYQNSDPNTNGLRVVITDGTFTAGDTITCLKGTTINYIVDSTEVIGGYTTLTITDADWSPNELVGCRIIENTDITDSLGMYNILSNTKNTITVSEDLSAGSTTITAGNDILIITTIAQEGAEVYDTIDKSIASVDYGPITGIDNNFYITEFSGGITNSGTGTDFSVIHSNIKYRIDIKTYLMSFDDTIDYNYVHKNNINLDYKEDSDFIHVSKDLPWVINYNCTIGSTTKDTWVIPYTSIHRIVKGGTEDVIAIISQEALSASYNVPGSPVIQLDFIDEAVIAGVVDKNISSYELIISYPNYTEIINADYAAIQFNVRERASNEVIIKDSSILQDKAVDLNIDELYSPEDTVDPNQENNGDALNKITRLYNTLPYSTELVNFGGTSYLTVKTKAITIYTTAIGEYTTNHWFKSTDYIKYLNSTAVTINYNNSIIEFLLDTKEWSYIDFIEDAYNNNLLYLSDGSDNIAYVIQDSIGYARDSELSFTTKSVITPVVSAVTDTGFIKIIEQNPFYETSTLNIPTYKDYYLRRYVDIDVQGEAITCTPSVNNTIELMIGNDIVNQIRDIQGIDLVIEGYTEYGPLGYCTPKAQYLRIKTSVWGVDLDTGEAVETVLQPDKQTTIILRPLESRFLYDLQSMGTTYEDGHTDLYLNTLHFDIMKKIIADTNGTLTVSNHVYSKYNSGTEYIPYSLWDWPVDIGYFSIIDKINSNCKYISKQYQELPEPLADDDPDVLNMFYADCDPLAVDCTKELIIDKDKFSCKFGLRTQGDTVQSHGCGGGGLVISTWLSCPHNPYIPCSKPTAPCGCVFVIDYLMVIPLGSVLL